MKDPAEQPNYSRRALSRLAFSVAAAQLSDRARARVRTLDDSWARPGEFLDEARALVTAAEELVERAIVYERECGASWTVLGEVLGVSKQAAQQKYGTASEDWAEAVDKVIQPIEGRLRATCLPGEGGETPEEHAKRLDAWLARSEKSEKQRGKAPVSDGLERSSLLQEIAVLTRIAQRMRSEADPTKLRAFHECKVDLLARIAESEPGNEQAAEAAENARRELDALAKAAPGRSGKKKNAANLRLVHGRSKPVK